MNDRAMRFRIGVFVLSALLMLAILITLFGSVPTLFRRSNEYTIVFDDATGLAPGTPVRLAGVRIGEVKSLELDDETGKVRVRIAVEKRFTIRRGDQPTLVVGIIAGDTFVDFVPRRVDGELADRTPVEPGAELQGVRPVNVNTLLNQASAVVPTTQEALNDIRKSLQRLEKMAPLAEDTMREYRDLARSTRDTLPEARRTNDEIQQLARDTRRMLPELRRTNDELQVAARNWGRLGERLDVLVQTNQDKVLRTLDLLNDTLARVAAVFNDENQKNLAATLKNIRAGTDNLESVSKNTDELLKEGRKSLQRVNETLNRTDEVLRNIQATTKPFAERGDRIAKNLDESSDKLNRTLSELRELLRVVGQEDGTFRRFVADPSLYQHLDETACNVNRLLPHVEKMLKDLEVFADKLARHPEALGLGGVVRPSSGLKDAPSGVPTSPRLPWH